LGENKKIANPFLSGEEIIRDNPWLKEEETGMT